MTRETKSAMLVAFAQARTTQLGQAGPQRADHVCRYCGKTWFRYARTKLDGHAKCYVTPAFKLWLAELKHREPAITFDQMAEVLEVGIGVIRSWCSPESLKEPNVPRA